MSSNLWRGKKQTKELCACGSGRYAIVFYSVIRTQWCKQCEACRDLAIREREQGVTVMISTHQDIRNARARKLLEELHDRDSIELREVWE